MTNPKLGDEMRKLKIFCTVFCLANILGAVIAWMSGYDFNTRSPDVGVWVALQLITSIMLAFAVASSP